MSSACAGRRGRSPRSERPQNPKRDHPRHREMETTRVDGVKASLHDGTPRSRRPRVPLPVVPHKNEVELGVQGLELEEVLGLLLGEGLHVPPKHHFSSRFEVSGQ